MDGAWVSRRPFGVEDELLGREPAHALHEAALDLADVDRRVEGASRRRGGCRPGRSRFSPVIVSTITSEQAAP